MRYPKYAAYKDSGVEWLGELPNTWGVRRLKNLGMVIPSNVDKKSYEDEIPVELCNYTDVYYHEEIVRGMPFMSATASQAQVNRYTLAAGDTLFTKDSESADDIGIAAYVPADLPGVLCGYHLCIVRPMGEVHGKYIKWFLDSKSAKAYFAVSANGLTRVGLSQYASDNLPIPLPLRLEQEKIALFLDHETSLIDALIAEQQRLIELLKEKRQAEISQAVTKGLDPSVPMKDSGVEWLGEVPEHWSVGPLKYMCTFQGGGTPSKENPDFWSGDIPWVSAKDMKSFWISDSQDKITATAVSQSSTNVIDSGALLIVVRSGILQRTIPVGINTRPTAINQDMKALIFHEPGVAEYIAYLIRGMEGPLLRQWRKQGATVESLEHDFLANTPLPLPPEPEIDGILEVLRNIDLMHDSLEREAQRAIELLGERRSALISAAVTGKIDVSNWHPPSTGYPSGPVEELVHG